jgi:hypothetical protein
VTLFDERVQLTPSIPKMNWRRDGPDRSLSDLMCAWSDLEFGRVSPTFAAAVGTRRRLPLREGRPQRRRASASAVNPSAANRSHTSLM